LLVTASVVPSSPIPVTLIKEALSLFLQEPLGVTSQKTLFFIVPAVKTSNLTNWQFFGAAIRPVSESVLPIGLSQNHTVFELQPGALGIWSNGMLLYEPVSNHGVV
jgi:hypothetical protein